MLTVPLAMSDKFTWDLEKLNKFNKDMYDKENAHGARGVFLYEMGGIEGVEEVLRTDINAGLSADEAKEMHNGEAAPFYTRKAKYGDNKMPDPPRKTLLRMIWEHCLDTTIIILACAAVVSLALGIAFPEQVFNEDCNCIESDQTGWVEGVAIIVAVVIIVMVGSLQDFDKEMKFRALGKEDKRTCQVIRDGDTVEILQTQVKFLYF
jgi:Ca2+-transporting ATPase